MHVEKKLEIVNGVETSVRDANMTRMIRLAARWFDRHPAIDARLLEHASRIPAPPLIRRPKAHDHAHSLEMGVIR